MHYFYQNFTKLIILLLSKVCNSEILENWTSFDNWNPEISASGGGNNEFQQYYLHPDTAILVNGTLQMHPRFVEGDLRDDLDMYKYGCTSNLNNGCFKKGSMHWDTGELHYVNGKPIPVGGQRSKPFRSTKLVSKKDFGYGVLEIEFKLPKGNFLWPAIWMLPTTKLIWPYGGEIDLIESMGNDIESGFGMNYKTVSSALHYGNTKSLYSIAFSPFAEQVQDEHFNRHNLDEGWHKVVLNRSANNLIISVDGYETLNCDKMFKAAAEKQSVNSLYRFEVMNEGYKAGFGKYAIMMGQDYPETYWKLMPYNAPFDGKFKLIVNLAIGGDFFSDSMNSGKNNVKPPWDNVENGKLSSVQFLENIEQWFNWGDEEYDTNKYVKNVCTKNWKECIKDDRKCDAQSECYLNEEKHLAYNRPQIGNKASFQIGKISFI
jgi:hypothetical protein